MFRKIIIQSILLGAVLSLAACGGISLPKFHGHKTKITSTPSGATVLASGVKIGKTPLEIEPDDAFPPAWSRNAYQASGILILKMTGCEEYSKRVSDGFLSNDIHVNLECSKQPIPARVDSPARKVEPVVAPPVQKQPVPAVADSIEQRLQQLEKLYKRGVITNKEYQKTRTRILSEI